jgi:hypothetical protein
MGSNAVVAGDHSPSGAAIPAAVLGGSSFGLGTPSAGAATGAAAFSAASVFNVSAGGSSSISEASPVDGRISSTEATQAGFETSAIIARTGGDFLSGASSSLSGSGVTTTGKSSPASSSRVPGAIPNVIATAQAGAGSGVIEASSEGGDSGLDASKGGEEGSSLPGMELLSGLGSETEALSGDGIETVQSSSSEVPAGSTNRSGLAGKSGHGRAPIGKTSGDHLKAFSPSSFGNGMLGVAARALFDPAKALQAAKVSLDRPVPKKAPVGKPGTAARTETPVKASPGLPPGEGLVAVPLEGKAPSGGGMFSRLREWIMPGSAKKPHAKDGRGWQRLNSPAVYPEPKRPLSSEKGG